MTDNRSKALRQFTRRGRYIYDRLVDRRAAFSTPEDAERACDGLNARRFQPGQLVWRDTTHKGNKP